MRYFKEVRVVKVGDEGLAARYIPYARTLLGDVFNRHIHLGGLQQYRRNVVLPDGTHISVYANPWMPEITIDVRATMATPPPVQIITIHREVWLPEGFLITPRPVREEDIFHEVLINRFRGNKYGLEYKVKDTPTKVELALWSPITHTGNLWDAPGKFIGTDWTEVKQIADPLPPERESTTWIAHRPEYVTLDSFGAEILNLTNDLRASLDLGLLKPPLKGHASPAAMIATEMRYLNVMKHADARFHEGYRSLTERVHREGFSVGAAFENIAATSASPQKLFDAWVASPGHYANLTQAALSRVKETGSMYLDYRVRTVTEISGVPQNIPVRERLIGQVLMEHGRWLFVGDTSWTGADGDRISWKGLGSKYVIAPRKHYTYTGSSYVFYHGRAFSTPGVVVGAAVYESVIYVAVLTSTALEVHSQSLVGWTNDGWSLVWGMGISDSQGMSSVCFSQTTKKGVFCLTKRTDTTYNAHIKTSLTFQFDYETVYYDRPVFPYFSRPENADYVTRIAEFMEINLVSGKCTTVPSSMANTMRESRGKESAPPDVGSYTCTWSETTQGSETVAMDYKNDRLVSLKCVVNEEFSLSGTRTFEWFDHCECPRPVMIASIVDSYISTGFRKLVFPSGKEVITNEWSYNSLIGGGFNTVFYALDLQTESYACSKVHATYTDPEKVKDFFYRPSRCIRYQEIIVNDTVVHTGNVEDTPLTSQAPTSRFNYTLGTTYGAPITIWWDPLFMASWGLRGGWSSCSGEGGPYWWDNNANHDLPIGGMPSRAPWSSLPARTGIYFLDEGLPPTDPWEYFAVCVFPNFEYRSPSTDSMYFRGQAQGVLAEYKGEWIFALVGDSEWAGSFAEGKYWSSLDLPSIIGQELDDNIFPVGVL